MAGPARAALILGGVLVAAVGAAIWFATSSQTDDDAPATTSADPAEGAASPTKSAAAAISTAKPKRLGTASVFGEIRRTVGKVAVVGQEVVLAPERGEPWTETTDAQGSFRFDHVPHGGPYELSVTAKGCGTIRLPGIALDRNQKRNVGTLYLDPAVKLTVHVRGRGDEPVAGALVEAFPIASSEDWDWSKAIAQIGQASISVAKTTTDAKGDALFPEMAVGEWTFTAKKEGFAPGAARGVTLRGDEEPRPVTIQMAPGYALSGRVLAGEEKPIAGALVMAAAVNSAWDLASAPLRARTTTDAEGHWSFAALPSGETQLWVARPGGAPGPAATVLVPLISRYDVVLGVGGTLSGTVTEKETGKPVDGATVRASSWEDGGAHAGEAVTDAAGKYSLEMPAGTINQLSVEKEGLVQVPLDAVGGSYRQAVLHEGETVVRDLALRHGARLHGVVKGPDGPVSGARVSVYVSRPGQDDLEKHATSLADGTYDFPAVEKGMALVVATKGGLYLEGAPEDVWNAIQRPDEAKELKIEVGESGDVAKDLEMKRGSIVEGRVDGPDGSPLAGARVAAPGVEDSRPTGADGAFKLLGVTPGPTVQLSCEKEGLAPSAIQTIAVVAGEPTTGIVIRMTPAPRVHGVVSAKSPGALRDAVALFVARGANEGGDSPWNERWRWQNATRAPVKSDGRYETTMALAANSKLYVRVVAVDAQETDAPAVDVVEGKTDYEVNVTLEDGASLAGKVVAKGGAPIARADVSVARHRGDGENGVYYGSNEAPAIWAVTDDAGEFRVPHLASARYDVRAQARGFVVGFAAADLASSTNVVVELSPETTIEGVVSFGDNRPVEGVEVQAAPDGGGGGGRRVFGGVVEQSQSAVTDGKGAFKITGLGDGRYTVSVSVPWGSRVNVKSKNVEGIAGGTKDLKISVEEGGAISGHVVDSRRKPVAHFWVSANATDESGREDSHDAEGKNDGTFVITGLGAGPYTIDLSADDSVGNYRPKKIVGVVVGTKDLEVVLEDGLSITGVVVDDAGKPQSQVALEFTATTEDGDNSSVWTDSAGKFNVSGLSPGTYRISVARWGGSNQGWVLPPMEPVAAGAKDLRLQVAKGLSVAGVVVDEDGKPLASAWVNASVVDPPAPGESNEPRGAQSKADGTFEVAGLERGKTYSVQAVMEGRVGAKIENVAVGAKELKLVLVKGLTTTGRVLDASGKPFSGVRLMFSPVEKKDEVGGKWCGADDDGKFTIGGLTTGAYEAKALVAKQDGNREWKTCGTFKAGDANVELRAQ